MQYTHGKHASDDSLCPKKPCNKKNLTLVVILILNFMKLVPETL